MFFRKKKQHSMQVKRIPHNDGIDIGIELVSGKDSQELSLPLSKEEIESYYKLPGFQAYVSWEELHDAGLLTDSKLSYEDYYQLLEEETGVELLEQLQLPVEEMNVNGELKLNSLPEQADLKLVLKNDNAQTIDRIGRRNGAIAVINQQLFLLPEKVYELQKAIEAEYETGYQKIGICQKLANEADIDQENFLENESYHVVDSYDLEMKVHSPNHIELQPVGSTPAETTVLGSPSPVTTYKTSNKRDRFVRTEKISRDIIQLSKKRHITGEEVPLFFENPLAVLPEHDYEFDLEAFSERVRGIIPIEKVRPYSQGDRGIQWFDPEADQPAAYDEDFLRTLMEQHPNEQYIQHENKWIYLDPQMRKNLLEEVVEEDQTLKKNFTLDIKDNETDLEYRLEANDTEQVQEYQIPQTLKADLFDHQVEGFQWLCHLEERSRGGLLADDMGLGKTMQVITFLLHQKEQGKLSPTLLVLPVALMENWIEEIRKFAPDLLSSLYIHKGSGRSKSSAHIGSYDLIFTTYDTLKIDQLLFGKINFQSIICDEAQNVKSHSSQRSRALRAMKSEFRLAMTGTPVENSLEELWAIMDFVQPGELNSLKEFKQQFIEAADYEGLLKAIQPYYLRRTKEGIFSDRLPKKEIKDPIYVEASKIQKAISESMLQTKETGQIAILNMLMRLRQLYGHPGVIIPEYEALPASEVPKVKEVMSVIDRIKEKDEKVLVFTEFRKLHSIFKRLFMEKYGISVPIIDGNTGNRQGVVKEFNSRPGFGIMLLSPKAAGVGLTITSANHVIHYTRWWNPAVENQATDRAYRIGQEKDVSVYQVITRDSQNFPNGTVEELMHELLENKQELAENVIIPFDMREVQEKVYEKIIGTG
ncbi:DEAD/DEAH box helicase [Guptibacillus hwajinpoensis]|uniref:DEAD/DEAH box helicase n=1 Tax=Guptibacillus hwajinpoensis TaxID=208199 RepID=UPI0024B3B620|nr:DEAD/DEAH box helicase [Pseudalkalibacillus hwajinpoensis]